MTKQCFKCKKIKELSEFYKLKRMADGHFNKCKSCYRKDVKENYQKNREHYKNYEAERWKRPERRVAAAEYQKTHRAKFPGKYKARRKVANAIKYGQITKKPCEICGDHKVEAHLRHGVLTGVTGV
jgi:hypothetical protein